MEERQNRQPAIVGQQAKVQGRSVGAPPVVGVTDHRALGVAGRARCIDNALNSLKLDQAATLGGGLKLGPIDEGPPELEANRRQLRADLFDRSGVSLIVQHQRGATMPDLPN
jgi:hypothetical protein